MIGSHVNQTVTFYEAAGAVRIKLDDGATEGRMVVDRIATDEDKKEHSPAWAAFLRAKNKDGA